MYSMFMLALLEIAKKGIDSDKLPESLADIVYFVKKILFLLSRYRYYNRKIDRALVDDVTYWYHEEFELVKGQLDLKDVYLYIVEQDPMAIEFIPHKSVTRELCEFAVLRDPRALRVVPDDFKTKRLDLIAVSRDPDSLEFIKNQNDEEICLKALRSDGMAIRFLKDKFKTENLIIAAVEQNPNAIKYVSHQLLTKRVCKILVKLYPLYLEYVPDDMKTYKMCFYAVKREGIALEYVPHRLKTYEMCLAAVENYGFALSYVPEMFKDQKIYTAAALFPLEDWISTHPIAKIQSGKSWFNKLRFMIAVQIPKQYLNDEIMHKYDSIKGNRY